MTPRTGRPRELEGSQRMTFYLDAETAEYLRSLPNASEWIREKAREEEKPSERIESREVTILPARFEQEMKKVFSGCYNNSREEHIAAENLMMRVLRQLGYEKGVEIFGEAETRHS